MAKNFISVILPVYNAEQSIKQAVDSILSQTNCAFELLIVDNASTDATSDIIHELAASDNRIKLFFEKQQGISYALNKGLREAQGKYIARMDADDISLPHRLEKQYTFLEANPEIGLISGLIKFSSSVNETNGYEAYVEQLNSWKTENDILRYRFVESPFAHPSVMYRKSLIDDFGYYSTDKIPEDYELWLRWMEHGISMHKLDDFVLQWNDSPNRLTRIHENCTPAAIDQVRYRYLANWMQANNILSKPIYIWGGGKLSVDKTKLLESFINISIAGIIDIKTNPDSPIPHIHFSELPSVGEIFIISMVSNRGRYLEIEQYLESKDYKQGVDFILAQ